MREELAVRIEEVGDHVCVVACAECTDVQLVLLTHPGEELPRAGPQSRVVPHRPRPVQLEVVHILHKHTPVQVGYTGFVGSI